MDEGIVGWTRWSIQVRVEGRIATVGAEMLIGRRWVPNFVAYRRDMAWEDGDAVSDEDRERIIRVLQASAQRRKMTIGVE